MSGSEMPTRVTVLIFLLGIIAATGIAWLAVDISLNASVAFFVAMLAGGSIYFVWSARE